MESAPTCASDRDLRSGGCPRYPSSPRLAARSALAGVLVDGVLRVLRVLRIFRMMKSDSLRILLNGVISSLSDVFSLIIVLQLELLMQVYMLDNQSI